MMDRTFIATNVMKPKVDATMSARVARTRILLGDGNACADLGIRNWTYDVHHLTDTDGNHQQEVGLSNLQKDSLRQFHYDHMYSRMTLVFISWNMGSVEIQSADDDIMTTNRIHGKKLLLGELLQGFWAETWSVDKIDTQLFRKTKRNRQLHFVKEIFWRIDLILWIKAISGVSDTIQYWMGQPIYLRNW